MRTSLWAVAIALVLVTVAASCKAEGNTRGSPDDQGDVSQVATTERERASSAAGESQMVQGRFGVRIPDQARVAARAEGTDLDRTVEESLRRIDELLPAPRAVVNIMIDPSRVIPEVGVGGFTNPNGDVSIWLDVRNPERLVEATEVWLPDTLAHEVHHQRRVAQKAGSWATLGDAVVTEGLATVFAREAFPSVPLQPWASALAADQERTVWELARSLLDGPNRQHERWFFGRGDLPRWAGYTLGVNIVTSYLRTHPGETAGSLVGESAARIIRESGYDP